jgi:hypothetical protein
MNTGELTEGQKAFYRFVMDRIQSGKEEEAEIMMREAFARYTDGTFTKEYMNDIGMRVMALLRFECIAEFLSAAKGFAKQLL